MKAGYLVDAGVVLRLLRGDHPEHSAQAVALFKRAEAGEFRLELTEITVAEVIWVLTSFYKVSRGEAANALVKLLGNPGVAAGSAPWLSEALVAFRDLNVDAADCFLAARATKDSKPVVSFDRDFRKFTGLKWLTPEKI
jgi:predicted nucleic acid-binding protein